MAAAASALWTCTRRKAGGGVTLLIMQGSALDIERIMPVMQSAFDPRYGEAWSAPQCAGMMSLSGTMLLVAQRGARVAGFALLRTILDESELMLIAVRPECQRMSVGAGLVASCIEAATSAGALRLHIEVRQDNPALDFYEKRGFLRIGCRSNYYRRLDGAVADAITLSLNLRNDFN